jgi:hypothetical protein
MYEAREQETARLQGRVQGLTEALREIPCQLSMSLGCCGIAEGKWPRDQWCARCAALADPPTPASTPPVGDRLNDSQRFAVETVRRMIAEDCEAFTWFCAAGLVGIIDALATAPTLVED